MMATKLSLFSRVNRQNLRRYVELEAAVEVGTETEAPPLSAFRLWRVFRRGPSRLIDELVAFEKGLADACQTKATECPGLELPVAWSEEAEAFLSDAVAAMLTGVRQHVVRSGWLPASTASFCFDNARSDLLQQIAEAFEEGRALDWKTRRQFPGQTGQGGPVPPPSPPQTTPSQSRRGRRRRTVNDINVDEALLALVADDKEAAYLSGNKLAQRLDERFGATWGVRTVQQSQTFQSWKRLRDESKQRAIDRGNSLKPQRAGGRRKGQSDGIDFEEHGLEMTLAGRKTRAGRQRLPPEDLAHNRQVYEFLSGRGEA